MEKSKSRMSGTQFGIWLHKMSIQLGLIKNPFGFIAKPLHWRHFEECLSKRWRIHIRNHFLHEKLFTLFLILRMKYVVRSIWISGKTSGSIIWSLSLKLDSAVIVNLLAQNGTNYQVRAWIRLVLKQFISPVILFRNHVDVLTRSSELLRLNNIIEFEPGSVSSLIKTNFSQVIVF